MEKELLNDIVSLIKEFNMHLKQQMPMLEKEVEDIISSGSVDKQNIERHLDTLVSLTIHGVGEKIFVKLLEYYKTVDSEGALYYWNEYDNQD